MAKRIIKPHEGFQERFVRSNLDVVFGGGTVSSGKSFGAILSLAEPVLDPDFRAVFLRRNLAETKVAGGMLDDLKKVYGGIVEVRESDSPRVRFPSGAWVDLTHISDENEAKLLERVKGWQYDLIYFDEGTSYEWSTFKMLFSRNRGKAAWTGKIRLTTNPKRSHWIRTFINDYVGIDGYIKPDWDGRVRYFFIKGETVDDVVWGDSKEEVYAQCRYQIDDMIARTKGKTKLTYKDFIKSFTFYLGNIAENTEIIENNAGYVGSVAAMGEKNAMANLQGNWNIDLEEEGDRPISNKAANEIFLADPCINGDYWITADLADVGTDNLVILVWNGFHIIDFVIKQQTTPKENADYISTVAERYNIPSSHIIYDAVRAAYMRDYKELEDAIGFVSYYQTCGIERRRYDKLKDECYGRLVSMINRQAISFDEKIGSKIYPHTHLTKAITIQVEFLEECSVVRFYELSNGKKKLISKKEMNRALGKGRSMDLLDPCAMRMYPILQIPFGDELTATAVEEDYSRQRTPFGVKRQSIYEDSLWC